MNKPPDSSRENKPKVIAAIPAYNEEKYIGTIVLMTRQYVDEVIVVDDGSADRTASIAGLAGATVVKHRKNKGYGASIQTLLAEAKKRKPDVLVLLDADYQHNPDEIPQLIQPVSEGFDLVIGSREKQKVNIPQYRRIGQRVISYFSSILSGKKLFDSESGFRAFSGKAVEKLRVKETGMSVSAEVIADASRKGLKITERPISTIYNEDGSTLNPVVHGFGVLGRIMVMISERKPLFFFGLSGVILSLLGVIAGIRVLDIAYGGGGVATGTALIAILLLTIGIFSIFTGIILHVLTKRES